MTFIYVPEKYATDNSTCTFVENILRKNVLEFYKVNKINQKENIFTGEIFIRYYLMITYRCVSCFQINSLHYTNHK